MYKFSKASLTNREGVDPKLIEIDDIVIGETRLDIGHGPDSGLRADSRQAELFKLKRSKADGVKYRSKHQPDAVDGYGKALDFTVYIDGKVTWDHAAYAVVALKYYEVAARLGYRIRCGISFKTGPVINGIPYGWDGPHVELLE